ncbi:hypothetical protein CRE_08355 [Caenorhabditis remanei]|uniref:Uncharacterized protein n=1 Tax=Caenorhabditis remanei TaxID=31234 RepID=E3MPL0_CAERE|nr:hypothetical protein CRE_08355 [Caenorhabditis remanei]
MSHPYGNKKQIKKKNVPSSGAIRSNGESLGAGSTGRQEIKIEDDVSQSWMDSTIAKTKTIKIEEGISQNSFPAKFVGTREIKMEVGSQQNSIKSADPRNFSAVCHPQLLYNALARLQDPRPSAQNFWFLPQTPSDNRQAQVGQLSTGFNIQNTWLTPSGASTRYPDQGTNSALGAPSSSLTGVFEIPKGNYVGFAEWVKRELFPTEGIKLEDHDPNTPPPPMTPFVAEVYSCVELIAEAFAKLPNYNASGQRLVIEHLLKKIKELSIAAKPYLKDFFVVKLRKSLEEQRLACWIGTDWVLGNFPTTGIVDYGEE